jgi:hypothetical protein
MNSNSNDQKDQPLPAADTGNASNPSPHTQDMEPANNQLLDERAEKYLRESANIEDEPDAQDQQDADEIIRKEQQS